MHKLMLVLAVTFLTFVMVSTAPAHGDKMKKCHAHGTTTSHCH